MAGRLSAAYQTTRDKNTTRRRPPSTDDDFKTIMAPNIRAPSLAYAGGEGRGGRNNVDDVISRIYLIRHGDRFDYA
jgi:hypothetical protein